MSTVLAAAGVSSTKLAYLNKCLFNGIIQCHKYLQFNWKENKHSAISLPR